MNENKVPHTVVPQEEVEKMAKTLYPDDTSDNAQINNIYIIQPLRIAWIAGYNAAIQSQSAKVDDAQSQLKGDIAAFEKFEKECKELADTTAYAYRAFNAGLSHARSQSQSVQPTGSVREIAKREFDKLPDVGTNNGISWHWWKRAYDSAARNLHVQSIQLSDMFEAMVHGLLISPGYYKCEKKDIDIEHWQKNFDKWVAWYMENRLKEISR